MGISDLFRKRNKDHSQTEILPTRRLNLRRRLAPHRALLYYKTADRANHTYMIFGQVRRDIDLEIVT